MGLAVCHLMSNRIDTYRLVQGDKNDETTNFYSQIPDYHSH